MQAEGYVCTTADLLNLLLGAAATRDSLESVCTDLTAAPNAATLRSYLNEQLRVEDLPRLEQCLNDALAAEIPASVFATARDLAIDYHDRPYYGKTAQSEGLWVRAEARDGTTRCYRVATAYLLLKDRRVTLAIRFVVPEDDTVAVLRDLLKRLTGLKISSRRVFLDRGFAGVRVIRFLRKLHLRAVIACPIRGKRGGTRALCHGRKSYRTSYTFASPQHGKATAELAVCRVFTTAKRTGRHPRRADWMIFILIGLDWTPKQTQQQYRRRFGIESSYRCARSVSGWTTSHNPAYRFVLIAVGFFLLNVWISLRWLVARRPRRGGRVMEERHFRLRRCARFIARAFEHLYGCIREIEPLSAQPG
ncbi:MAG: hypothetical protein M3R15_00275 [Acidobacteriota bacterium]|nr:hypothetical protein [Acidobacteriota bacterium]